MNAIANKKQYFTFKENVMPMPMHRMPSPKYGREHQMARVYESPMVMNNRMFGNMPVSTVAYKESYSSAMEPMDHDDYGEWGNEDQEMTACEMNAIMNLPRSRVQVSKEIPPTKKNMKMPSLVKVKPKAANQFNFYVEKPLHQSILSVDSSKGLSFQVDPNQKKVFPPSLINFNASGKKIFPVWGVQQRSPAEHRNLSLPRMFTVTIDKLQTWPNVLTGPKVIFELYGILDNVSRGAYSGSKNILLKSEGKRNILNCTFYEIDRDLPAVAKGQWQRCIILLRSNGNCQCLTIRSAKTNELKNLDKMIIASSKEKAQLLRALSP